MNAPRRGVPPLAERLYALALHGYPRAHRRAYGALMQQAFRDGYRDALATRGRVGPRVCRAVLSDLVRSVLREQQAALQERTQRLARHRLAVGSGMVLVVGVALSLAACAH